MLMSKVYIQTTCLKLPDSGCKLVGQKQRLSSELMGKDLYGSNNKHKLRILQHLVLYLFLKMC